MADLFHVIEGAQAIVHSGGVFKQAKLYRRGKDVYAGHSAGFVKLHGYNGTSHPRVSWREIETGGDGDLVIKGNQAPRWEGTP